MRSEMSPCALMTSPPLLQASTDCSPAEDVLLGDISIAMAAEAAARGQF